jgi:hypothetical protein
MIIEEGTMHTQVGPPVSDKDFAGLPRIATNLTGGDDGGLANKILGFTLVLIVVVVLVCAYAKYRA